jgi:hypothetical protein
MYKLEKNGAIYRVRLVSNGLIQFASMHRALCKAWMIDNEPVVSSREDGKIL